MPALHALLVGIDRHRPQRILGEGLIPDLQGCVRDVERMETFLRRGPLGVPGERIRKLVSPQARPGCPLPAAEGLPTYRNLVREIEALAERAVPGDQVLVHYSGHGASLPTVVPEKKGLAGRDECLVPCDAAARPEEGGGFLRDLELHALLARLAERGLRVTLILDCCHSGGVTRDLARGRVRGLGNVAYRPSTPSPLGPWESLGRLLPERRAFRHVEGAAGWFPQPEGSVLLAACLATEYAREYPFGDGAWSGALTHFFLDAAGDQGVETTYRRLHQRLLERGGAHFQHQTPVLEGNGDMAFLGRECPPEAVGQVLGRREHLALYRSVERIADREPLLRDRIRVELFAVDGREDWAEPGCRVPVGACAVPTGTLLCLLVHNESERGLNVAVLDLQPDWGISRVHPNRHEGDFTTVPAGTELPVFLRVYLPEGMKEGRDRLLVIAATGALDTSQLELDALGTHSGSRSFRNVQSVDAGSPGWAVQAVELRVVEAPAMPAPAGHSPAPTSTRSTFR